MLKENISIITCVLPSYLENSFYFNESFYLLKLEHCLIEHNFHKLEVREMEASQISGACVK